MNDEHSPTGGGSRRELLLGSLAAAAGGGAALLVASCGGSDTKSKSTETVSTEQAEGDAAILNALLDLELSAVAAYTLATAKLGGPERASAQVFLGHERRHAAAIERAIGRLGGTPIPPRPQSQYASTFPRLRGQRDALSFLLDVENTAVAAYADALGKIATDGVRATAAAILVAECEHAAVVLGELGRPQVPQAFVTGPPPQADSP
jgi:hypothetical protein